MTKETIKNLPLVGKKLVGWYSAYLRLQNRKVLRKNLELKNKFAGRRAFVIATGPSIKNQDLKKLAGELCISVSNFFVHPDFPIIKPEYHLFAPTHMPLTPEQFSTWMKDAEAHFPEGQNVLISVTDKHIIDKYGLLKKQNVYYYFVKRKTLEASETIDFSKPLPAIQTSVHIGIYLGVYLGVSEIYLLGCDHDWILHLGETRHFYDEKKSVLSQANYDEWAPDLEPEFAAYVNLWKIYKLIRNYARSHNIRLVNCTPGSLLDVLPKINLDEIIGNKSQP